MKNILITIFFLLSTLLLNAQEVLNLYPETIPNAKSILSNNYNQEKVSGIFKNVLVPTLEIYWPEKNISNGTGVIICPGGGYSVLVYDGEGINTANQLIKKGITAFVLKYRLPNDSLMNDKSLAPLQDAQQAIKMVRENADQWGINPNKIGIMGFSAGGHLASTLATHYYKSLIENKNNTSLRPDFQILIYPVISMQDSFTHKDSRRKLLGEHPQKEQIDLFSNELQLDKNSPPAYLTHASDDTTVDVDNSIIYFEKLRHLKIPVEIHVYPKGGHGFVFRHQEWIATLFAWMKNQELIN
jgi:acetyl esterase/lipase